MRLDVPIAVGRTRRRAVAALATAAAVALAGCALGQKSEQADRIHASLDAIAELDIVATLDAEIVLDTDGLAALAGASVDAELPELPDGIDGVDGDADGGGLAALLSAGNSITLVADVEPGARKASAVVADEDEPASVFLGDLVFVRRQNARDTERRKWAKLDLTELRFDRAIGLDDLSGPALVRVVTTALNPVFFVELVSGALAGSVEVVGAEQIGDSETTHYDFNLSFDKAMSELDFGDDERMTRLGLFRQFGITKDVVPGGAWVDDDGRLRRFRVELPMQVTPIEKHELTVTVDLAPAEGDVFITAPEPEVVVSYETLGRLMRASLPEGM